MNELDKEDLPDLEARLFSERLADLGARLTADSRLARVWSLIRTEYADPDLTLAKAARAAGASKNHLNVLLRGSTGFTFHQLLLRYRLLIAADSMKASAESNSLETPLTAGFGTLRAFEKSFRRFIGCSPQAWKTESSSSFRSTA
jgi:AraC-like DNA-binding protein